MENKKAVAFLDLRRQYQSVRKDIDAAVKNVLSSGRYVLGKEVDAFEDEFSRYCGSRFGIGVASGTEALYLALLACGIKAGDEVITVPNAGIPSTVAIELTGAVPVFTDVDPATYNIDPARIEKAITRKTKAIIPVHLYGQCADMDAVRKIAFKRGLKIIEDACQAHGASYKGRRAGSMGDAGCFSFYPTKNLGCYGDGGLIVTSDKRLAEKMRMLRDYGQAKRYVHEYKGINSRLDEIQAAILRVKLKYLDSYNRKRAEIAETYGSMINNRLIDKPEAAPYGKHVFHLYVVTCRQRERLRGHLMRNGVESLVHYPATVYLQKAYSSLKGRNSCPVSEVLSNRVLSLPLYPEMEQGEIELVSRTINKFRV